jgi:tetratricopeptide (TPR) repeat protein
VARKQQDEKNARVGSARWRLREADSAVIAGRLPEAADLYAVAAYELDGLDPRDREVAALLARALAGHGRVDLGLGNPHRALVTVTKALELVEPDSAPHAAVLCLRACALRETGALDDAVTAFAGALAIQRAVDRTGEVVVGTLTELSRALRLRGDAGAAERAAREAVELAERIEPGGLAAAVGHHALREALDDLGRVDEAEVHLVRCIDLLLRHVPDAAVTADAVDRWCRVVLARQGPTDTLPCLGRHLAVIEPEAPGAPVVGVLRLWRAIGLASLGSDEADSEALREFEDAERVLAGHPDQAERAARARAGRTRLLSWRQRPESAERPTS